MKFRDVYDAIHRGLMQRGRLLMLWTPLGSQALIPVRAKGAAKVGRGYRFVVDAVALRDDIQNLELEHQPVTLFVQQPTALYANLEYRPIHGFVHRFNTLGLDGDLTLYQLEFESALFFLGKAHKNDQWFSKSARDILLEVFNQYPQLQGRVKFLLSRDPDQRSYTRQSESDLNFIHRLLEDEGWYFYFEHEAVRSEGDPPVSTLVIVDSLSSLPDAKPIEFSHGNEGGAINGFTQWAVMQTAQSLAYETTSFNYKNPTNDYSVRSELAADSTTYTVDDRREQTSREIPYAPMVVREALSYGYADSAHGLRRAQMRTQAWDSQARRYLGVGAVHWIDAGTRFTLEHHTRHMTVEATNREFLAVEVRWLIENNVPLSRQSGTYPLSLQREIADTRLQYRDEFDAATHQGDGSTGLFRVEVEAQRTNIAYRSPFEHKKPVMHAEHAIVNAPDNEEAWTDERNRVYGKFPWDQRSGPETFRTSPPMLVMQADTGYGYGGVHVPRKGEWILVDYLQGDCDRPFVLGRLNAQTTPPQWHSNVLLSGFMSRGFGSTGAYNSFVHDDATHQSATRITTYSGKDGGFSLFHQGYLVTHEANQRGRYLGRGILVHTDDFLGMRANRGLYIGTYTKSAGHDQLDVHEAREQLNSAEGIVDRLSTTGELHHAESLKEGQASLKAFADATEQSETPESKGGRTAGGGTGSANAFKAPVMVLASPSGIGLTTQQSVHIASEQQTNLVSGASTHIATGKSLLANVTEKISLFVRNAGMKLFAAKGKIEIQAQSDGIELTAQRSIKVVSATETIEISAQKEILITAGEAYIRLSAGNIEIHAPGNLDFKGSQHAFSGPASMRYAMPSLPLSTVPQIPTHEYTQVFDVSTVISNLGMGGVLNALPYRIYMPDGTIQQQGMLVEGATTVVHTPEATKVKCEIGAGDWGVVEDAYDHEDSDEEHHLV
ncbi:type VI secretion system Vgr family protein [Burkholderia cepacia]|uniref:type VI secretion system Vgr family protein n=1 Tax=Burkholderia cepacia TaxID=292 RepID=UPI001FC7E750|nr:type VI secretion system Vgr family protein [Burkholderia cepacia]